MATFTDKQIYDLNNMNVAAQNVQLGTLLSSVESGKLDLSGGTMTGALILNGDPTQNMQAATKKYVDDNAGESLFEIVESTFTEFDATEIGNTCDIISAAGKIPVLKMQGSYFHCAAAWTEGDTHGYNFSGLSCSLSNSAIATIYIDWIEVNYTSNEWSGGTYSAELSPSI